MGTNFSPQGGSVYLRKVLSRLSGSLPKAGPVIHATQISLKEDYGKRKLRHP